VFSGQETCSAIRHGHRSTSGFIQPGVNGHTQTYCAPSQWFCPRQPIRSGGTTSLNLTDGCQRAISECGFLSRARNTGSQRTQPGPHRELRSSDPAFSIGADRPSRYAGTMSAQTQHHENHDPPPSPQLNQDDSHMQRHSYRPGAADLVRPATTSSPQAQQITHNDHQASERDKQQQSARQLKGAQVSTCMVVALLSVRCRCWNV
jgi:hypothetical protein